MEVLKPVLKRVTSIDFGRVTHEDDFKIQILSENCRCYILLTISAAFTPPKPKPLHSTCWP